MISKSFMSTRFLGVVALNIMLGRGETRARKHVKYGRGEPKICRVMGRIRD